MENMELFNEVKNLILTQEDTQKTFGLYNGLVGEVLILFLLLKHTGDKKLKKVALNKLNLISENISENRDVSFDDGLAGIGWAIEWIVQNKFLDENTDQLLEDIDDLMYQSVIYTPGEDISISKGILGRLLYFWMRDKNKNPDTDRLKTLFHEECLVLLTDDLYEIICNDPTFFLQPTLQDLINMGHLIYILSNFLWLRINTVTVESTLYKAIKYTDDVLKNEGRISCRSHEELILGIEFLTICYYFAGHYHRHKHWKETAENKLKKLYAEEVGIGKHNKISKLKILNDCFRSNILARSKNYNSSILSKKSNIYLVSIEGKQLLSYFIENKAAAEFDLIAELLLFA